MTNSDKVRAMSTSKLGKARRKPGRPALVDRESILNVASTMALPDITLIAIAKKLNVSSQALYRYYPDRNALVLAVLQRLMHQYPLPDYRGEDWCDWAYKWGCALYNFYQALPGLAESAMAGTPNIPEVLNRFETSIKIALQSDFDEIDALWVTQALTEFVHTWVARDQKRNLIASASGLNYRQSLRNIVDARSNQLPLFSSILKKSEHISEDARFEHTLSCLLNGLSKHRRTHHIG